MKKKKKNQSQKPSFLHNVKFVTTAAPPSGNYEVLNFGDCYVRRSYQESFTMTNHTDSQVVKFNWPSAGPHISFSPKVNRQKQKKKTKTKPQHLYLHNANIIMRS